MNMEIVDLLNAFNKAEPGADRAEQIGKDLPRMVLERDLAYQRFLGGSL